MADGVRRAVAVASEGALAGLVVGLTYGAWAVGLHRDVSHRMFVLACLRLSEAAIAGAVGGIVLSLLLAGGLAVCARRGPRYVYVASATVGLLFVVAAGVAAFPLREAVFPLHYFTPRALSAAIVAVVMAATGALVARRLAAARSERRPVPRRGAMAAVVVLALLVAGRLALAAAVHPRGDAYSVLLVSIDTLRADRLGVLGSGRDLTPNLDRLAREGVLFTAAESTAPWTLPAHASLFTSQLPGDHRVQGRGNRIAPARRMLTERFRDAGYRTAAFTAGGYLEEWYGFAQGFETFEIYPYADGIPTEPIVDAALGWIGNAPTRPFFAFVHTYAPHVPYRHAELADADDAGRLAGEFSFANLEAVRRGELVLTEDERRYVTDLYDGGVAYADRALGRLFDELRRRQLLDSTIVVVLSDHGEDLWDHVASRSPDHGHSLYEELTHVPLLIRAPGLVAAGSRIHAPVSLVDVAPTVLGLAGLPADGSYAGADLAASCRHGSEPPTRPIYSESTEAGPDRFALRLGDDKAIVAPRPGTADAVVAPPLEVFDLASDPGETRSLTPVPQGSDALVSLLETRVQGLIEGPAEQRREVAVVPEELSDRLRALGYTQ